jgi:Flp pilus assembly pilin Flp
LDFENNKEVYIVREKMKENINRLMKDERGMSVVETLIITGLLGATAVLGWSIVRDDVVAGGETIGTNTSNIVESAGTVSEW